jgi:hypothetical protein
VKGVIRTIRAFAAGTDRDRVIQGPRERGARLLCHRQTSFAPRYPSPRKADSSGQLARQPIIRAEAKRPGAGAQTAGGRCRSGARAFYGRSRPNAALG